MFRSLHYDIDPVSARPNTPPNSNPCRISCIRQHGPTAMGIELQLPRISLDQYQSIELRGNSCCETRGIISPERGRKRRL